MFYISSFFLRVLSCFVIVIILSAICINNIITLQTFLPDGKSKKILDPYDRVTYDVEMPVEIGHMPSNTGRWSPDCRKYAIISRSGDFDYIDVFDIKTRRLWEYGGRYRIISISWSNDSKYIAVLYSEKEDADFFQIGIFDYTKNTLKNIRKLEIKENPRVLATSFTFDRSSKEIYFLNRGVFKIDLDKDLIVKLTDVKDMGEITIFKWCDNRRYFVYVVKKAGKTALRVMSTDGKLITVLYTDEIRDVELSPDGKYVLYNKGDNYGNIYLYKISTGENKYIERGNIQSWLSNTSFIYLADYKEFPFNTAWVYDVNLKDDHLLDVGGNIKQILPNGKGMLAVLRNQDNEGYESSLVIYRLSVYD